MVYGNPPKDIALLTGNASMDRIPELLREHATLIFQFGVAPESSLLQIP
ncbi:MAG: hypothetical protein ACOYN0_10710 [Phycisphaerales bacterium]